MAGKKNSKKRSSGGAKRHNSKVINVKVVDVSGDLSDKNLKTNSSEAGKKSEKKTKTEIKKIEAESHSDGVKMSQEILEMDTIREESADANREKSKKEKNKKKWPIWAKILTGFVIFIAVILVASGIFVYSVLNKTTKIFNGNPVDLIIGTDLKKDINGRSNVLIFGTSEDEEGHGGAMLTDSIIVLSVDQERKDAKMFSVPRDLWVEYGVSCSKGSYGKINAIYECGVENYGGDKKMGAEYFKNRLSQILGIEIQYYLAVDWTVVKDVVNTLGGIDVDIYTDDPAGINDYAMGIKLPAGINHLDGVKALKLARARNALGGYGLSRSNFDREINQQRIINAIKVKVSELGFLANPSKILEMLDALGNNIKTNITSGEIRRSAEIASGMKGGVESVDTSALYTTGYIGPASVVLPAGTTASNPYYYGRIQMFVRRALSSSGAQEATTVE